MIDASEAAHPADLFADLVAGNSAYSSTFALADLAPVARRGLAIITCMDSRIEPLALLDLRPGDAKILRNAGARVTDDVLRTLILAVHLLGVQRVLVMPHTRCRMAESSETELHQLIDARTGHDTSDIVFGAIDDQLATLRDDVQRIRRAPYLPDNLAVAGAVYDVSTGRLGDLVTDAARA